MEKHTSGERVRRGVLNLDVEQCAEPYFYDDVHGAQNHCFYGCEQCAKMGVRNYILRIYVCAHPT